MSEIATQPKPASKSLTLRENLESDHFRNQIAMVLPKHMTPERMVRVAITAMLKTPDLAKCEQSSFFLALLNLSQMGLEPDGRHAHLIPFRNNKRGIFECQLIVDYKGLVELAHRSGDVSRIHADVIRDGDVFEYDRGMVLKHTPWFLRKDADKPDSRGEVIGAYCEVQKKDGTVKAELMEKDDIEDVRKRSRAGSSGPWVTDWNEMAKKTAFKRLSKWISLSAELRKAIDLDDDRFDEIARSTTKRSATSADEFAALLAPAAEEPEPETVQEEQPLVEAKSTAKAKKPKQAELVGDENESLYREILGNSNSAEQLKALQTSVANDGGLPLHIQDELLTDIRLKIESL